MVLRLGNDHTVDHYSRNLHLPRVEGTAIGYPLHLGNDQAV